MTRMRAERRTDSSLGYAKPGTYEELLAVLTAGTAKLSRRSQEVAIHISQHPDEVALASISEIALAAGVQPSALVRFAQVFGFSGWSELQELFKAHLRGGYAGGRRAGDGTAAIPERLGGLVGAAQSSLAKLPETLDPLAFGQVAGALAESASITLIGSKRAFPVTTYLSFTLSQHGVRNSLVDNIGSGALDQVGCLGPGDGVLAVSFSPYNSITPELAALARERGARLVALTDSPLSPLVPTSEASLLVVERAEAGYRTLAATMVVALALAVEVAARRARPIRGAQAPR
jgi:DNA-binding MurR/RpiR family transcriptional regulator